MNIYTVRIDGHKIKDFAVESEAKDFAKVFIQQQVLEQQKWNLINEASFLSDLKVANEAIKHIMEL
jgi:hypothetical protein